MSDAAKDTISVVVVVTVCFIALMIAITLCGIGDNKTHEKIDEYSNKKAWCESLNAKFGNGKCFKDGEELQHEE